MNFSTYQQAIFDAMRGTEDNLLIEAVAGSGKTTTIVEAAKLVPQDAKAIFLAFNKNIASELSVRLPPHVKACTLHSLGYRICMDALGFFKANENKTRNLYYYWLYNYKSCSYEEQRKLQMYQADMLFLVSMLKAYCVNNPETFDRILPELVDHYDLDSPTQEFVSDLRKVYAEALSKTTVIDYDDMIFLPAMNPEMVRTKYDYIFVDEAQDLSPIQSKFLRALLAPGGRIIFVGDSRQAIYGFRGASPDSMDTLQKTFSCNKLPLSISYRCGARIVEVAKTICPQIEARPGAHQGEVTDTYSYFEETLGKKYAHKETFILCRTLAPLQAELSRFVRANIPINVDYPELLEELGNKAEEIRHKYGYISPDRVQIIGKDLAEQQKRYKLFNKAASTEAKYEVMRALIELFPGENNYPALFNNVLRSKDGVRFLSIHKAKGLEAKQVIILQPELIPHPKAVLPWQVTQEYNLKYVAVTRAIDNLVFAYSQK